MPTSKRNKNIIITKSSGEHANFSSDKLRASLQRSGARNEVIDSIIEKVQSQLYEGMPTKKIYKLAFDLLKKAARPYAARYKLKNAIMELGPSGFPFERFISELLKFEGYQVQVGIVLQGKCVTHEIDVLAEKNDKVIIAECKYHNLQGMSSDVKVPLYIHSRFNDVVYQLQTNKLNADKKYESWVFTNTNFTSDASQYGACAGMHLVGWNYPISNNLRERIDRSGLYPITCLSSITRAEKQLLMEQKIVLCAEINRKPEVLKILNLSSTRNSSVLLEVQELIRDISN